MEYVLTVSALTTGYFSCFSDTVFLKSFTTKFLMALVNGFGLSDIRHVGIYIKDVVTEEFEYGSINYPNFS